VTNYQQCAAQADVIRQPGADQRGSDYRKILDALLERDQDGAVFVRDCLHIFIEEDQVQPALEQTGNGGVDDDWDDVAGAGGQERVKNHAQRGGQ